MTLLEKLASIAIPPIAILPNGKAMSIEEIWDKLILPYIPKRDVVLRWHDLLMDYVASNHPTFAIRGYNSFSPERYCDLRRGFLTKTQDFSFFYTDNFFAFYIQKMSIDGFVPTLDEFITSFKNRQFPSRFGMNTAEERALLAVKQGKDPKINSAGFMLAHIIPVGKEYNYNGQNLGITYILENYFPKGERTDWKMVNDITGDHYRRDMIVSPFAEQFAVAHFLRFVHPFNYFLCPKKTCENNDKCKALSEYSPLLSYAHDYNLSRYGNAYREYLSLIMPNKFLYSTIFDNKKSEISVKYGLYLKADPHISKPLNNTVVIPKSNAIINSHGNFETDVKMLIEYLNNPDTSFRKLEVKYLGINSAPRGGGFVAKGIINSYGITAAYKGILKNFTLEFLINKTSGVLKNTLQKIQQYFIEN